MVEIIAEAGLNHLGSLETALRMVDVAKECGADVVKFQIAPPEITHDPEDAALLERCWLTYADHERLMAHCAAVGIEYLCTPFTVEAVEFLWHLGVKRLKIPSGEITNVPLLQAAAATGLPVILSTGASTVGEVELAYSMLRSGVLTVLHCVSAYPTPPNECHLRAATWMQDELCCAWGWSDHTPPGHTTAAVAAVALGATVIERHFFDQYPRTDSGYNEVPDQAVSDDPDQLARYISAVREAEAVLGDMVVLESLECEEAFRKYARRGADGRRPSRA